MTARIHTTPPTLRLVFHRDVLDAVQAEIRQRPDVEVGGKFVGHVHRGRFASPNGSPADHAAQLAIFVTGYIDAGPDATRTATYHLPDGPYQANQFRFIERADRRLEHLGSWHSHHPNGLAWLSDGDIDGYFANVNHDDYNLDFFLASLMIDRSGFATAKHYVFVRGWDDYFHVPRHCISVVNGRNRSTQLLAAARSASQHGQAPKRVAELPFYRTDMARAVLERDRAWLDTRLAHLTARLDRASQTLSWTGVCAPGAEAFAVRVGYPASYPRTPAFVELESPASGARLRIDAPPGWSLEAVFDHLAELASRLSDSLNPGVFSI